MRATIIFLASFLSLPCFAQEALDTLFFNDGRVEAVQISGLTDKVVQYNYYGEGILISTPKTELFKVKTRAGRVVLMENTAVKKTVHTCEDWDKVVITSVENEVLNMVRNGNVSGKAKGVTVYTQAGKMQDRAMNKMKMEAAFRGCDVIFMLSQQVEGASSGYFTSKTAEANMTGTAYSTTIITPAGIKKGDYKLAKVVRLQSNDYELDELFGTVGFLQEIEIDPTEFKKDGMYYSISRPTGLYEADKLDLIYHDEQTVVLLVIEVSRQGKTTYYNFFYQKKA